MLTVADLGKQWKRDHPGVFDDLSDVEVGRAAKRAAEEKGSNEFDNYEDVGLSLRSETQVSRYSNVNLPELIQETWDNFDSDMGMIVSTFKRWKTTSQNRYLEELSNQQTLFLNKALKITEYIIKGIKDESELELFIERNDYAIEALKAETQLILEAAEHGMTLANYQQHLYEEQQTERKIKEAKEISKIEVEREEKLAGIRTKEYKEKTQVDLDRDLQKAQESVRLAILSKVLDEHQKIMVLQDALDIIYNQIDVIEKSNLSQKVKDLKIEDRMDIAETFKKDRRARQNRLLQANN